MNTKTIAVILTSIILIFTVFIGGYFLFMNKKKENTAISVPVPTPTPTQNNNAQIANPASVFCNENGGKSEIRTAPDGGQTGYCKFHDGSECEEWAYYKGECKPGDSKSVTADISGWQTYRNEKYGFEFKYPKNWHQKLGESIGEIRIESAEKEVYLGLDVPENIEQYDSGVSIRVYPQDKKFDTLEKLINSEKNDYGSEKVDFQITTIGGINLYKRIAFLPGTAGDPSYILFNNSYKRGYIITLYRSLGLSVNEYDNGVRILNEILSTFKFIAPE